MRFLKIFSALVLVSALLYSICFAADGSVYHDVLRLHIIADSDSAKDQETKLLVRDFILENYSSKLSGCENRKEAEENARALLSEMESEVNAFLAGKADYTCRITLEERYFPTKTYGEFSLPRGNYTALCITLGKGGGQNFWCVLFPPLCLNAATADTHEMFLSCGLTEEEYLLMRTEKPVYKLKFRLLELLGGE